jgi:hypothetical protein
MDLARPPTGTCARCKQRPATTWWSGEGGFMAAIHGMVEPRCELCCVEEQFRYARKLAATLPELAQKLTQLRGLTLYTTEHGHPWICVDCKQPLPHPDTFTSGQRDVICPICGVTQSIPVSLQR